MILVPQGLHFENHCPSGTEGSLGPLPIWAIMWTIIDSTGFERRHGKFHSEQAHRLVSIEKRKKESLQSMAPFFLFLIYSKFPHWGKSNQSMQIKPFTLHEDVHLLKDMPEAVVRKASHASTSTPPQKGHQNKWNRTP